MKPPECKHDYAKPIRKGRAHYVCRKCGVDITMILVILEQCKEESEMIKREGK